MATDDFSPLYVDPGAQDLVLEAAAAHRPDGSRYQHVRMRIGRHGGVIVVAHGSRGILFGRSYRPAVGRELLELPRGLVDPEDLTGSRTPRVAAGARELLEETGFEAIDPIEVGRYIVDSAVYPLEVSAIACRVADDATADPDGELSGVEWIDEATIDRRVACGDIVDAHSITAVGITRAWRDEQRWAEGRGAE